MIIKSVKLIKVLKWTAVTAFSKYPKGVKLVWSQTLELITWVYSLLSVVLL